MSFGGFGGFGQSNSNQQSSGFGGFGSNTNTSNNTSAFGSSNTGAFGTNTSSAGGGLFGGGGTSSSGFGSGGFGSNTQQSSGFGSKPAFGSPAAGSGGGLFGSSNTNTGTTGGFGGFGSGNTANTTNTSTFGSGSGGGGLFGSASKPAFGSTTTPSTGGSLFGGGGATSGGFGASNNPGIGGNVGDPPGTANTPFQAFIEREGSSSTQNSFQNILFQDPYKKWSADELRLADYAQGRRHGNATGAGAFGVSSGFGSGSGFGSNTQQQQQQPSSGFGANTGGSGLFGSGNTAASTGFGAQSNTGTGFGSGSGGGLFGQNKPATGTGMFGSATSQPAQSGGLFGSTTGASGGGGAFGGGGTSTGGFGSGAATGGGGLFGGGATQNKPAGGLFGGNTGGNTTGGFGSTGTTGGFGSTNTNTTQSGGLFGGGSTTQTSGTAGGGLFGGGQQQQQQQSSGFGSGTGFGAQNQQKPGGLFGGGAGGGTSTGGGLFGGGAATGGGGFGQSNTAGSTGTGLFGAAKPATGGTGGGLFGGGGTSTQPAGGTGTGLFGGLGSGTQNQQQQQTGGGMFSSLGQNQPKPSLFGGGAQQPAGGGGLFGNQGAQQQGSLFGNPAGQQQQQQPQQQQVQGSLFGGSMLGGSQGQGATPQSLSASITDVSAYGTPSLFSNQGNAEAVNPGPLATPLSSKVKPKRGSILPMYKLNPASARYVTPQKRGFGFSYSTYGTPGSASSTASTPGTMGRSSLLGASLNNRSLNKSVSASSLRRSFNAEDSILTPGAFSASGGPRFYGGSGSSKKLIINKDMRSDLFSTPTKDRPLLDAGTGSRKLSKRVSFDTSTAAEGEETDSQANTPIPNGSASASRDVINGLRSSPDGTTPEMESVKGNELAIVHEEAASPGARARPAAGADEALGSYWMSPTKDEILDMNRMQRQKVSDFVVGRHNVGQIAFKAPVDLSNVDLDDLFGNLIILETRSATVYPVAAKKPSVGKGLNVPSQISLEQSFPRGKDKRTADPRKFARHIERLKRIEGTTFENYDQETGVWTFSVEHFTTYGLDDDESDDESMAVDDRANGTRQFQDQSSEGESDPDDTFDFRQGAGLPGAFDQVDRAGDVSRGTDQPSFLGVSSAGSAPQKLVLSVDQHQIGDEYELSENEEMTSGSLGHHPAAEQDRYSSDNDDDSTPVHETPGGILRARMRAIKESSAPVKMQVADGDDWMDMLQKTVSPQKRDRAQLRDLRDSVAQEPPESPTATVGHRRAPPYSTSDTRGFATSIDLMNSLFERPKVASRCDGPNTTASKGFLQWPYERQSKIVQPSGDDASEVARARWGPDGTLVLPAHHHAAISSRVAQETGDIFILQRKRVQDDVPGVVMAKFSNEHSAAALHAQIRLTKFGVVDGVPKASLHVTKFAHLFHDRSANDPGTRHEKVVWELAGILFDDISPDSEQTGSGARKSQLSRFWRDLVADASATSTGLAKSSEAKALASLAGHRVQDACNYLIQGKNYHLGTLVALIDTDGASKKMMKEQLLEWHNSNFLSEFSPPIRAIFEMLSGNVCVCEGKKGVPIEDRLDSFVISDEFQLNWKQAFGMRLWYGISPKDDISAAVGLFRTDIEQERERPPPTWFAEDKIKPLWEDPSPDRREDLLWGLLKLYADDGHELEEVLRPENSQLSPVDFRLCWQLEQALTSTNKASYRANAAKAADAITFSFASQLASEGNWLEATFVLLHVTSAKAREQAIRDHLCRHASLLGPETGDNVVTLTQTFKIPAVWIWEAQALYMRSVEKDAPAEVQCLIRAGAYAEAHRRLVEQVAPQAIIERDYQSLSDILSKFEGKEDLVADWPRGGEVYQDFLLLKQQLNRREATPTQLLRKLIGGLPALQDNPQTSGTYNTAAVTEMSGTVVRAISDSMDGDQRTLLANVQGLPLTEDVHLAHSVRLSLAYYKVVMAR